MNEQVKAALDRDDTIDITTIGRKSGQPRRIEIWFRRVADRTYITGTPGTRDWYANMVANPNFTFHLKQSHQADLPATARPILDASERRRIMSDPTMSWYHANSESLDAMVANSPLVEVIFEEQ
ncbi:MAG: nitroreductase/quinone reductase family protein [Chloroflexota bacterium]